MIVLATLLALLLQSTPDTSVTGRIVRAGTSEALVGARVLLTRVEGRLADSVAVTTDDLGRFELKGISPGAYRLFADHEDHVRVEYPKALTVVGGQPIRDLVLPMVQASVIVGRVVDSDNAPVSRVYVRARHSGGRVYETQTNDLGEYRLYAIPPGMYTLSAARYPGAQIEGNSYIVPTPPGLDSRGEGRFMSTLTNTVASGGFIDPRALTGQRSETVQYPGPEMRPIDVPPGTVLRGIDFRL